MKTKPPIRVMVQCCGQCGLTLELFLPDKGKRQDRFISLPRIEYPCLCGSRFCFVDVPVSSERIRLEFSLAPGHRSLFAGEKGLHD